MRRLSRACTRPCPFGFILAAAAVSGAIALVTAAKKFSKSLIVMGVPPFQEKNPVDCLLSRNATMKTCTSSVTSDKLVYDKRVAAFARAQGVGFMDPTRWFCARVSSKPLEHSCPLVVNRTITRLDVGHVSASYVGQLAPSFRNSFRLELFRWRCRGIESARV